MQENARLEALRRSADPEVELLSANSLLPTTHRALLRGIADELTVYEIP